jgi:glyoxylase-like metal-dependent hydrolase (beta-lactamase superfamily II)
MTITAHLTWEVFVSPLELTVVDGRNGGPALRGFDDLPPGVQYETWSPISSTLITGQRDAVLVDPLMTTTQARVLAGWIAHTGKNLTTIYVTHGHGDHHFGLSVVLDRFPAARAVAAPAVVERMRQSVDPDAVASFWAELLPGQIPERLVVAEPLKEGGFDLEGHDLVVMDLGHTDTENTTCLHVPDIGLVVAGDAVYNDVHDPRNPEERAAALDLLAGEKAKAFVGAAATLADQGDLTLALEILAPGLLRHPENSELADLRQSVLMRLMEQRQLSDPFGFLYYAELAGAELAPVG